MNDNNEMINNTTLYELSTDEDYYKRWRNM